jgi:hypothetical protein
MLTKPRAKAKQVTASQSVKQTGILLVEGTRQKERIQS